MAMNEINSSDLTLETSSIINEGIEVGIFDHSNLERLNGNYRATTIGSASGILIPSLRTVEDFPEDTEIWLHRNNYRPCVMKSSVSKIIHVIDTLIISSEFSPAARHFTTVKNYGLWREEDIVTMAKYKKMHRSRGLAGAVHYLKAAEMLLNPRADANLIDNINRQLRLEIDHRLTTSHKPLT